MAEPSPGEPASIRRRPDVTVRPARADDEQAIHELAARCLPDAFAGLVGDYLPPRDERMRRERSWTGPVGAPHPRHALLVAERSGRLVGFAAAGPTRDADGDGRTTGELRVVMVAAGDRGAGVGRELLAAGERAMRRCGLRVATLWVVPENVGAARCYERCGWTADGAERLGDFGGRMIRSVRYRKRLTPER
jgi:ribosomal protein S18 acetylase RimI-like enzyme